MLEIKKKRSDNLPTGHEAARSLRQWREFWVSEELSAKLCQ